MKRPIIQNHMELTFKHLYDNNFGIIATDVMGNSVLIMPSGFTPELGKSYPCRVNKTTTGTFVYNGRIYHLAIATRQDQGDVVDEMNYLFNKHDEQRKFSNKPFAQALTNLSERG